MKRILLPAFILLTVTAIAQENKAPYPSVYELLKSKGIPGKITYQFSLAVNTGGEIFSN